MKTRKLGKNGPTVSAIGLGCMGMSHAYGGYDEALSLNTLAQSVEEGITFFDTAEVYGPYVNEELVGRALRSVRDRVTIATKFGFNIRAEGEGHERMAGVTSRPEHIRKAVDGSLKRLGIEAIDLLYQHRVDPAIPIEEVVSTMSDLVQEGKVRWLGLSEASSSTLRRAHRVHPISALQSEYSLWSRDVEGDILTVCRELGIGLVPYSPLGRGFLTGKLNAATQLSNDDFRHTLPRFQQQAMEKNSVLLQTLRDIAGVLEVTPAQVALAWVLAQGDDIVPIPGARQSAHLLDNIAATRVVLNDEQLNTLSVIFDKKAISGERFPDAAMQMVNL